MSKVQGEVSRQLHTLFHGGKVAGLTDGQLLERFLGRGGERSELAFASLVERHGPMVLRVSRNVLRDPHDAEDVFQATFLVLALRARSIRDRDSLGSWLHGVALRVAAESKASSARRRSHERRSAERVSWRSEEKVQMEQNEVGSVIHEELDRLPERFRTPLILCYLQGMTHDQAAERLACPVGTVRSRLARGRARISDRLVRRGLASPTALGFTSQAVDASPLSATLANSTVQAAIRFAAGPTASAGTISEAVAALTKGVLSTMFLRRWISVALLTVGVLTTSAGVMAVQGPGEAPTAKSKSPAEAADSGGRRNSEVRLTSRDEVGIPPTGQTSEDASDAQATPGKVADGDLQNSTSGIPIISSEALADEPPSDREIWERILPLLMKRSRIQVEKIGEKVDPSKNYPLAGDCQLVHRHYKCTVSYGEPGNAHIEVVYIDKDYLRRTHGPDVRNQSAPTTEPAPASPAASAPRQRVPEESSMGSGSEQDRRLKEVERKLDQVLKALADMERNAKD